ncbi:MAG: acyltransferase family protein [Janthinobacterium lividum]
MKIEVRSLTGLRGVAATWVALYHIHWQEVFTGQAWPILRHGYLAVDVFFVLSGFVMMMTYSRPGHSNWTTGKFLDFLVRRIGRVWPAYILVTLSLCLLMGFRVLKGPVPSLNEFVVNFTLTESWFQMRSIDEPAWSVSAEFAAYILFPFASFLVGRSSAFISAFISIILIALDLSLPTLQAWVMVHPITSNGIFDISSRETMVPVARCLIEFALGNVLFGVANQKIMDVSRSNWVAVPVMLIIIFTLCVSDLDYLFIIFIPVLIIVTAASGRAVSLVFSNPAVYLVGCWSYSLYLIHFHSNLIQTMAQKILSGLGWIAIPLSYAIQYGLLLSAAGLMYRFWEKPALRVFRGFGLFIERAFGSERLLPEASKGAV